MRRSRAWAGVASSGTRFHPSEGSVSLDQAGECGVIWASTSGEKTAGLSKDRISRARSRARAWVSSEPPLHPPSRVSRSAISVSSPVVFMQFTVCLGA